MRPLSTLSTLNKTSIRSEEHAAHSHSHNERTASISARPLNNEPRCAFLRSRTSRGINRSIRNGWRSSTKGFTSTLVRCQCPPKVVGMKIESTCPALLSNAEPGAWSAGLSNEERRDAQLRAGALPPSARVAVDGGAGRLRRDYLARSADLHPEPRLREGCRTCDVTPRKHAAAQPAPSHYVFAQCLLWVETRRTPELQRR